MSEHPIARFWPAVPLLALLGLAVAALLARTALAYGAQSGPARATARGRASATALLAAGAAVWLAASEPAVSGPSLVLGVAATLAGLALVLGALGLWVQARWPALGLFLLLAAAGMLSGTIVGWLWGWTRPTYVARGDDERMQPARVGVQLRVAADRGESGSRWVVSQHQVS